MRLHARCMLDVDSSQIPIEMPALSLKALCASYCESTFVRFR